METTARKPRWVLVVDDDPGVAVILREAIEQSGFHVNFAQSVSEATAKLNRQVFDCNLTDLKLGHGSGKAKASMSTRRFW
jgi:ActR/RegA family two-component response regulator